MRLYQHYKGNTYELLFIANDANEPGKRWVVYRESSVYLDENKKMAIRTLSDVRYWVRSEAEFFERLRYDGNEVDRFTHIGDVSRSG